MVHLTGIQSQFNAEYANNAHFNTFVVFLSYVFIS